MASTSRPLDPHGRLADAPGDIPATGWKDVATRVRAELRDDHMGLVAAGVAFYGFLALVPALAAAVSVAGLLVSPARAEELVGDVAGALPSDARDLLASQLQAVTEQSNGSLSLTIVVSLALSLWAASGGMGHLVEAINVADDEQDDRGMVARKARALSLTVGAIVFVLVAFAAIALLPPALRSLGWPGWARWIAAAAVWPLLGAAMVLALAVLYRVGPDRTAAKWRWVTWGAVIAVVVWIVASIGFQIYAGNFASYNETYGSLAAVVVLLMWLWLSSYAVLLGAEINAELEHQTARDSTVADGRPLGERGATMADTVGDARA